MEIANPLKYKNVSLEKLSHKPIAVEIKLVL